MSTVIDVVMITNGKREELLKQSIQSLFSNCKNSLNHFVLVHDGMPVFQFAPTTIINRVPVGASRCRNIGASSIPKYRRGQYVMFCDDDVYMCPGWDERLIEASKLQYASTVSGHAHPYNHTVCDDYPTAYRTTVLSTVHMFMSWQVWDDVGYFIEPGGPGGSEDVDWCKRCTNLGGPLYVTKPHCVIHTGLTNSKGEKIVGYNQMVKQNVELTKYYHVSVLNQ